MLKSGKMLLNKSLNNAATFCNYSGRICMQNRLEGFDLCSKHILEDKNSPFKQCSYVSGKTNRRCTGAVLKSDKRDGFCSEHAYKVLTARKKSQSNPRPNESLQTLLEGLDHHPAKTSVDGESKSRSHINPNSSSIFDYSSSSESDSESLLIRDTWKGDGDSAAESIDSEQEDLLKHAGVYTADEVASIFRDKLIKLQSLYIDQFKRLHHLLREKRRKYIRLRKFGTGGSIPYSSFVKLRALQRYQKRHGKEKLLHKQCRQRRVAFSEGSNYEPPSYPNCVHEEDGRKCSSRPLPLSEYCIQHIMEDSNQVLYQQCYYGNACCRPVAGIQENVACDLHVQLQPIECRYSKKEQELETKDEHVDVVGIGSDHPHRMDHGIGSDHPNRMDHELNSDVSSRASFGLLNTT